jgi:uncharacterized ferredoxin-like protein
MDGSIRTIAELMEISAITAPKAGGKNYITTKLIEGAELQQLGAEMIKYGEENNIPHFVRDGNNVKNSALLLLIGLRDHPSIGLNCGACGYGCPERKSEAKEPFNGPNCIIRALDLGIALGSAVKMASILNVDNRIMYRAGAIAKKMKLMADANIVIGIPLSATGKSIYFDR